MNRSKLLEQIVVVADGTTAFAKGTASTAVVVAAGSGTLQTCETSSGTFEDYATLAEGQNNIDLSGAKQYLAIATTTGSVILGDFATGPVPVEE
jgi:hypothetical protein